MPDYIDIHSHISFPDFESDRANVLSRMRKNKTWALTVGVDFKSSQQAIVLAEKEVGVFATIGQHPADNRAEVFDESAYRDLVKHPKVVAIGECGLDFFRIKENVGAEKIRQKEIFKKQIELALEADKPLMLHVRPSSGSHDAYDEVLSILKSYLPKKGSDSLAHKKLRGNVHFFAGSSTIAKKFFEIGFTISFTGVITFAREYDEAIKSAPLEMLMSETDCPWVSPIPFRGKRNEPIYVAEVVKKIAEIRDEDFEVVRKALVENAFRVFGTSV
jgi:TatD DNase family protein